MLAAQVDSSVISGESGTGKELIAKSLHLASSRKNGPFVAIDCEAIPENCLRVDFSVLRKGPLLEPSKPERLLPGPRRDLLFG